MLSFRTRLRQCLALALLAAAALALAPSVARALQVAPLALAVCGSGGIAPDGAAPGHCPLCSQLLDGPAGLPARDAGFDTPSPGATLGPSSCAAPRAPRAVWASAAARAPPASSC